MSQLLQVKPAGSKTDSQKSKPNITFHIVSGKFKENIEEGGKEMDPYVKLKIGSQEYKTDVALGAGKLPEWKWAADMHVADLDLDVQLEVWEWDKNSSDDFLAAGKINLQSALAHENKEFSLEVIRKGASIEYHQWIGFGFVTIKVIELGGGDEHRDLFQDKKVKTVQQYLNQTGLSMAFQIVYAEVLTRDIPKQHVYAYTALRLREIGADLQLINSKQKPPQNEKILDKLTE